MNTVRTELKEPAARELRGKKSGKDALELL